LVTWLTANTTSSTTSHRWPEGVRPGTFCLFGRSACQDPVGLCILRPTMANRPDGYELFDIDPGFQEKLQSWLSKTNTVVDIAAGRQVPDGFWVTIDPGGEVEAETIEEALRGAMKSRSRATHINPKLERKLHTFMVEHGAHVTFGADNDGFNMLVSNDTAKGQAHDEDLEVAMILAEEEFWDHLPENALPPAEAAELRHALVPPLEREEALRQAVMEPRHELEANRRQGYASWVAEVNDEMENMGARFEYASREYWRQLYNAGFSPHQAAVDYVQAYQPNDMGPGPRRAASRWQRPHMIPPRAPSQRSMRDMERVEYPIQPGEHLPDDHPFDPESPRHHYARAHHFAVNARWTRAYINSLPDSAFLYVEAGGTKDKHGRSHPLTLRHLPYKNRSGEIDEHHLRAALSRVHQARTDLPKAVKDQVFEKAQRLYDQHFGASGEAIAANPPRPHHGSWRIELAGGDVDPDPFSDYVSASRVAQRRYGDSGWVVTWHSEA